jgi:GcrA cell cycle regulator
MSSNNWTDEAVARLRELWAQDWSCSEIAARLPGRFSRNAVIGKANRLGLEKRRDLNLYVVKTKRPRLKRQLTKRFPTIKPAGSDPVPELLKAPDHLGLSLDALKDGFSQCRFIHGDVREGTHSYCGQPTTDDSSYCGYHAEICRPRRKAEAA